MANIWIVLHSPTWKVWAVNSVWWSAVGQKPCTFVWSQTGHGQTTLPKSRSSRVLKLLWAEAPIVISRLHVTWSTEFPFYFYNQIHVSRKVLHNITTSNGLQNWVIHRGSSIKIQLRQMYLYVCGLGVNQHKCSSQKVEQQLEKLMIWKVKYRCITNAQMKSFTEPYERIGEIWKDCTSPLGQLVLFNDVKARVGLFVQPSPETLLCYVYFHTISHTCTCANLNKPHALKKTKTKHQQLSWAL